jgi:hypothetical protein
MAPTKKASSKKARPASTTGRSDRARIEESDRVIRRIGDSLDGALKDLPKVGGSVGAGVGDLRKDLAKLLRDARRYATKMSSATRKDLEKLQKEMKAAAKSKPGRGAARKPSASRKSRATGTATKSRSTASATKPRAKGTARKASSTGAARASRAAGGKGSRTTARKRSSSAAR